MESSRAGPKLSNSCPWDQNGNCSFHPTWLMVIAERTRARASAPEQPSSLTWSCFPFRTKPSHKQRRNNVALAEKPPLLQSFCLKPFEDAGLHVDIVAKA